MPNGGSDCCGTCWFNKSNGGEAGFDHRDESIEPYCEIRDVAIENPFYTYCANHPHRRPDRDPIPIGPITRYAGDGMSNDREVWIPSPDSEEIRQHLLEMLEELTEQASEGRYPIGPSLAEVVIWQLGEFREKRAEDLIFWISEDLEGRLRGVASEALAQIQAIQGESEGEALTKRMYEYGKWHLEVIRTSPHSATVNLVCEDHEHGDFIIGKVEGHTGWGVGRKDSGSGFDGSFTEAVEHCGDQLIFECDNMESIAEVDEFFAGEENS